MGAKEVARLLESADATAVHESTLLTLANVKGYLPYFQEAEVRRAGSLTNADYVPVLSQSAIFVNHRAWVFETGEQSLVLGSQYPGPMFSGKLTTDRGLKGSTDTVVDWSFGTTLENQVGEGNLPMWSSSNSTRVYCRCSGMYLISWSARIQDLGYSTYYQRYGTVFVSDSSSDSAAGWRVGAKGVTTNAGTIQLNGSAIFPWYSGRWLRLMLYQDATSSATTSANFLQEFDGTTLQVKWLSGISEQ